MGSPGFLRHPNATCQTFKPVDDPLVMVLDDLRDNKFEEVYVPHLQQRHDWVILTPPLPNYSKKKSLSLQTLQTTGFHEETLIYIQELNSLHIGS